MWLVKYTLEPVGLILLLKFPHEKVFPGVHTTEVIDVMKLKLKVLKNMRAVVISVSGIAVLWGVLPQCGALSHHINPVNITFNIWESANNVNKVKSSHNKEASFFHITM